MAQGFCVFTTEYKGKLKVSLLTSMIARDCGRLVLSKQLSLCRLVTGYFCVKKPGNFAGVVG